MSFYLLFAINSVLLGFGLAMDAFSVSLANGFAEPGMKRGRMVYVSGIYALFQFAMPVIGWILVHFAVVFFKGFQRFIPLIALGLLAYIGGKMVLEGIQSRKCLGNGQCEDCPEKSCEIRGEVVSKELTTGVLLVQGIATSIDALSVGFTIADYNVPQVIGSAAIIGVVTHVVCFFGLMLGTKFGTKMSGNARIVGGIILIGIGLEIFIKGILGG